MSQMQSRIHKAFSFKAAVFNILTTFKVVVTTSIGHMDSGKAIWFPFPDWPLKPHACDLVIFLGFAKIVCVASLAAHPVHNIWLESSGGGSLGCITWIVAHLHSMPAKNSCLVFRYTLDIRNRLLGWLTVLRAPRCRSDLSLTYRLTTRHRYPSN